jgi:RNA polymerase sigma-70 factor, ECF subfamily
VETSDETLCERVARGDGRAFEALVERYRERAYRLAWSMLRNAEDARDLSQEAFIRLHRTAGTFRGRARFSTWFYRILVNLCLDHRRRHRWWGRIVGSAREDDPDRPSVLERQPAPDPAPDEGVARSQTMSALWSAVDRLSPQQRAAVLLQMEDLTTREIAGVLACTEATVRVHLHRALSALRKTLGKR